MKKTNTQFLAVMLILFVSSCDQPSRYAERNKNLIAKANEEFFVKGNLDYADEIITPDYTFPGFSEKGPSLIKSYLTQLRAAFPDLQIKVENTIAEGNLVAWKRTHTGTQKGDFMGYKAMGETVSWQEITFTRFTDDGKIAEEWGTSDFDVAMQRSSGIDGFYENLSPNRGQGVLHNGWYSFTNASANGSATGVSGTYTINNDVVTHTVMLSSNPKEVGTTFSWKVKSWSGDTVTLSFIDEKGEATWELRSVRVSY